MATHNAEIFQMLEIELHRGREFATMIDPLRRGRNEIKGVVHPTAAVIGCSVSSDVTCVSMRIAA